VFQLKTLALHFIYYIVVVPIANMVEVAPEILVDVPSQMFEVSKNISPTRESFEMELLMKKQGRPLLPNIVSGDVFVLVANVVGEAVAK